MDVKGNSRLQYIDVLKGIAIILVLIGHRSVNEYVTVFIYMFHMPLFFFISGYLDRMNEIEMKTVLKKKAKRLLYPYVTFGILIILYNTCFEWMRGIRGVEKLGKRLIALLYGNYIWENNSDYIGTLWFLVALFCVSVLSNAAIMIAKENRKRLLVAEIILLICGAISTFLVGHSKIRLPWCLDVAFVGAVFYIEGYVWRKKEQLQQRASVEKGLALFGVGTILGITNYLFMKKQGFAMLRVDMLNMNYGLYLVFIISALFMSVGIFIMIECVTEKFACEFLARTGKLSLLLMIVHIYVYQILNMVLNHFHINYWILFMVISFGISYALAYFIDIYLPFLVTTKKKERSKMKVVSFIPIKLNNQRLPGKNTMELAGRPTCDYIFETISQVDTIDEKYVYCSDEAIKPYIAPYEDKGLRFLKRDPYLDGFQVKGLEIIDRFVKDVDADIYVLTHVTQPFTKPESIKNALDKVISGEYDSAFSAVVLQDYMWMNGKPFNYDMKNIVRTQDLEPIYMETGAFFIFRKEVFTELGQRIGNKPYIYEIDQFEAVDIDTAEDFEFAKAVAMYKKAQK